VLTHYSFKYYDAIFTAVISLTFLAILVLRYGYHYFSADQSLLLQGLRNLFF
jgi:hypothetical protein